MWHVGELCLCQHVWKYSFPSSLRPQWTYPTFAGWRFTAAAEVPWFLAYLLRVLLISGNCEHFWGYCPIFVHFLIRNWNLDCTRMSPSCYLEMKHKKEFIISELWWLPPEHFVKFSDKNCQKSRSCFHRSWFKRFTGFPFIHFIISYYFPMLTRSRRPNNPNWEISGHEPDRMENSSNRKF